MDQNHLNCDNSFYSTMKDSETGDIRIILEDTTLEISRAKLFIGDDTQVLPSNCKDPLCVNYLWVLPTTILLTIVATVLAFASVLLVIHRNKKKHSREFIFA